MLTEFLAYSVQFTGGVNLAAGDLDGDGREEVITAAGRGGGPHVRVFTINGTLKSQFFAYDQRFTGGVKVASSDLDSDGKDEIITAPFSGGGPHIRVFNQAGQLRSQFFAYDASYRGGVSITVGDVDNDGLLEIVTALGPGAGPHLKIFNSAAILENEFFVYTIDFNGGVNVSVLE